MAGRTWLIAQLDAMHAGRGGDWYYRTFAPSRALAELDGVYVVNLDLAHRRLAAIVEQADVLVINGVCSADLLPVIAERRQAGRLSVFEVNDDVEAIQAENPLAGFFSQPENLRLFRRLALSADAVQYSVPELERRYGGLNPRGRVFVNQVVAPPPLRSASPREPGVLNIGWGGSSGHFGDMAEVAPALIAFVDAHPGVTLQLMCSDKIWQLFDALPEARKQRTPVGSIDDYYAFVSTLDVGIAPNRDRGFNRARSDVKFLEYAGWGAVAVVQRLTPYLDSVVDGETGFLFGDAAELTAVLQRLVREPDALSRVRRRAHAYVLEHRLQSAHASERLSFYAELLPTPPPAGDAAGAFAALAALEGAEVSGRHVVLSHARYERSLYEGVVALQSGRERARGEASLRSAARLAPEQALPHLFLGVELDSEPELRAALAKRPRSVEATLALGRHLLSRSQFKPALERFLAAAEIAPGYEMPFAYAAEAMRRLGAAKEAAEFERLAQNMAAPVAPTPPAPVAPAPSELEPAWKLLERGVHLETLNPNYAPSGLLEMIEEPPRRVLDVGCFCGGTGRYLKRRYPGCEVVGIEMLEKAAELARQAYDRVLVGTLEQLSFERAGLAPHSFDVVVAADVLEHLFNPWQALERLRGLIAPGGALYVSLPNLRNLKLLSELGRGRFDYAGSGILDVTHVRFFTRATAVAMLEQTGFVVEDVRVNPDARLASVFGDEDLRQLERVELDGLTLSGLELPDVLELSSLQLFFRARPAPAP